jgi:uncharacterized protein (UPF0332 family)
MQSPTPFDPKGFLDLADSLVSPSSPNEAELRSAISRAYYALFLKARRNLVLSNRMTLSATGADHRTVINVLKAAGGKQGHVLDKLLKQRRRADYDLHISPTPGYARQIVQTAKNLWAVV